MVSLGSAIPIRGSWCTVVAQLASSVERSRLSVLSRPIIDKLSSRTYFETHFIEAIERLSNIDLCWKSAIGWMRRVLGLQSPSHQGQTIDATPSKGKVQIVERKWIDDKRKVS